ncbi:DUF3341 domain-containing protein [bacterium]|nr:DUF3341 domain-containing protein [bacterium]
MTSPAAVGVVGLFDSPEALLAAIPRVKARNLGALNAYTPYPVHGLERALGIPRSPLGYLVLAAGLFGVLVAIALQGWTNAIDYPQVIGGKPFFAWPAYFPIIFEVMVLLSAFATFLGMLGLFNRLPYLGHPLLASDAIAEITRDRFALSIEKRGEHLDLHAAEQALLTAGSHSVEFLFPTVVVKEKKPEDLPFAAFATISLIVLSAILAGWAWHWVIKLFPELPPMAHMLAQPRLDPQEESLFFMDGRAMRTPPAGTIARGHRPYPFQPDRDDEKAGRLLANPLPQSEKVLVHGRQVYETNCAVCHGLLGDGKKMLSDKYMAQPANLHTARIRQYPDGRLFHVMTVGKGTMPAYGPFLSEDDRWSAVHYLRVLQQSQNATEEQLAAASKGLVFEEKISPFGRNDRDVSGRNDSQEKKP